MEQLGLAPLNLVWQILAFLMLMFLLQRFGFKPILRIIDERAARIRESMETAERIKQEMAETENRNRSQLDQARLEAQNIIAQANRVGDRAIAEAREQARAEAEKLIARAREEINSEKEQTMAELRKHVANLAIMAASKIVGRTLDPDAHYRLIEDALAESDSFRLKPQE
jgi:F-type H+-transporting ATPase subunit b